MFLFFSLCLSLSPFSNTIEPKGHFIDHSEVMSPIVCLLSFINLNVILYFIFFFCLLLLFFFFHSEHLPGAI